MEPPAFHTLREPTTTAVDGYGGAETTAAIDKPNFQNAANPKL